MDTFIKPIEIRWSDIDPNFHLRHSVYYDFGAYSRICFLDQYGLNAAFMAQHHLGPILFREECVFRKEIRFGDVVSVDLQLSKARKDQSRWTIQHNIYKNQNILAAVLTAEGAWIDTEKRKLTVPPPQVCEVFETMPRTGRFEWIN